MYMAVMSVSDGSVSSRYKSSITCAYVYGSAVSGDYIAVTVQCISYYLLMFNMATNQFNIRSFSGSFLYGIGLDTIGRFVVEGYKNPNGYIAKSTPQSFSAHPDFQTTATWTMNLLASGTEDIVADSGQTIGAITPQSVSAPLYTNLTVTYVPGTSYTSDVNYLISDQSISVIEGITSQNTPDLPCSISGSTSISFSISNYLTPAPSWVTINSISGVLSITAPAVTSNTEFDFYINSAVSGISSIFKKLIKLTVLKCTSSN